MKYGHDLRHYPFFGSRTGGSVTSCRSKEMHFLLGYVALYQALRLCFSPLCLFLQSYSLYSYRRVRGCMGMCRSLLVRNFHLKVFGVNIFSLSLSLEEVIKAPCCIRRIFMGAMNKKMWSWTVKACKVGNGGKYDTTTHYFSLPISF